MSKIDLSLNYKNKVNMIFWNGMRDETIYLYDSNLSENLLKFANFDDFVKRYYEKYYTTSQRLIYINNIRVWLYYLKDYFPNVQKVIDDVVNNERYSCITVDLSFKNKKSKRIKEKYYLMKSLVVNAMDDILNESNLSYEEKLNIVKDYILNITNSYQGHTIASMAINERNLICNRYNTSEVLEKYGSPLAFCDMRSLEDKQKQLLCRYAYHGGLNIVNWRKNNQELENIYHFDCNSLYSYIQSTFPLPKGQGILSKDETKLYSLDDYRDIHNKLVAEKKVAIFHCLVSLRSKKGYDNDVLNIFGPNRDEEDKAFYTYTYKKSKNGYPIYQIVLTNVDMSLLFSVYDVEKLVIMYKLEFETCTGRFNKFINIYYQRKAELKEAINKKETFEEKIPLFIERAKVKSILNFSTGSDGQKKYIFPNHYLPYIVFTTAFARFYVSTLISRLGNEFIYSNTDSILCTEKGKNLLLNYIKISNNLGDWKLERVAKKFKILNHNTYIEVDENGDEFKCLSGLDKQLYSYINFDNFEYNLSIPKEKIEEFNLRHENKLNPYKIFITKLGIFENERNYTINIPEFNHIGFED